MVKNNMRYDCNRHDLKASERQTDVEDHMGQKQQLSEIPQEDKKEEDMEKLMREKNHQAME